MLDDFVPSETHLREARPDIVSVLPPDAEGAPYDARAGAYAEADRPLLLVDRSLGMLVAARDRIADHAGGTMPNSVTLLQADANDLPLRDESIDTVLSMGMLHLFDDTAGHVGELGRDLAPGGTLFAIGLVAEQWPGRAYLRLLHRAGEVAAPRRFDEIREAVASGLDAAVEGGMAFFTAKVEEAE